jgi:hypothetical protein
MRCKYIYEYLKRKDLKGESFEVDSLKLSHLRSIPKLIVFRILNGSLV